MDCEVTEIVNELLSSYCEVGGINNIDCTNLPSKRAISSFCEELLQLLFPGFLDEGAVASDEISVLTFKRVTNIITQLKTEVARSLRYAAGGKQGDYSNESQEVMCDFLRQLPEVRRLLSTDVEAAYDGDPAAQTTEEIILAYPCIEAIAIQRAAHILYNRKLPLIPRMMTEWAHSLTGIDIHPGAQIGSHFFIDHGTGVVVGETCIIGSHVKLYHGVTLGARSFPKDDDGKAVKNIKRHPNVEDYVTIYPNATILGGETTIGARSTIGASAFLMTSVPPDTLIALDDVGHKVSNKKSFKKETSH
jgi:serine O-acetyltransferase